MLLTLTLLQRVCNNFMVIEVWNRIGPNDQGDKVKLMLTVSMHTNQKLIRRIPIL